ncbi:MAG: hypothetical protein IPN95_19120 [Bacteroidetes bacterium]|nr:hypothetical protein [Bacteroidota bacterium]
MLSRACKATEGGAPVVRAARGPEAVDPVADAGCSDNLAVRKSTPPLGWLFSSERVVQLAARGDKGSQILLTLIIFEKKATNDYRKYIVRNPEDDGEAHH